MSKLPFVCLNVEPESEDDEEIDNTAEIKLEEALKLYQQALKLHAQGPSAFAEAQDAYDELFDNDIFTYSQALSFRKRQEALDEDSTDSDDDSDSDSGIDLDQTPLDALLPATSEGGPSTLRQVAYLTYKNYGQFQLDRLQHELVEKGLAGTPLDQLESALLKRVTARIRKSLESFADALDKDDTDVELWRQVARLTALLGSQRMNRFCLETVLATTEDDNEPESDDLVTSIVREDLGALYGQVWDDVAKQELGSSSRSGAFVSSRIRTILDPCPSVPKPAAPTLSSQLPPREAKTLRLKTQSWLALGKHIQRQLKSGTSQDGDFSTMCVGFHVETTFESTTKSDESKGRRRRTIDSIENQRNGHSLGEEADSSMGGVDGVLSPGPIPLSPTTQKSSLDAQAYSPLLHQKSLPVRGSLSEEVRQDPEALIQTKISPTEERSNPLKRSPEAAGLAQEPPEARSRSKRLRARESGIDDDGIRDQRQQLEKQLEPLEHADRHLFSICETLLKRMSVTGISGWTALRSQHLGSASEEGEMEADDDLAVALGDLKTSLKTWNGNRSSLLLHGTGTGATATLISKGNEAGLANFLEHAKSAMQATCDAKPSLHDQDLDAFIGVVNHSWLSIDELALAWLINVMAPQTDSGDAPKASELPKYMACTWSVELKALVHDIISYVDDFAFKQLDSAILSWDETGNEAGKSSHTSLESLMGFIQTMFEIQLDMYDSMIKPTSKVDQPTRILQKARLQRWAFLSSQAIAKRNSIASIDASADLVALRHLFSMTLYLSLDEESSREHIIQCLQEVKDRMEAGENDPISLPNIDIMPEISIEAIEQEISRLTTTDFFMSVFNPSDDDPVATIESLEPIILPLSFGAHDLQRSHSQASDHDRDRDDAPASPSGQLTIGAKSSVSANHQKDQLLDFLSKSTASLRLSLWNRLTNAYSAIDAPPFVFLCTIHSLSLVLSELKTPAYTSQPETTRMSNLLIWIRNLIDLVDKCCGLVNSETTALACMDEDNLHIALCSVSSCVSLFHLFALWDDRIRLGQTGPPAQQAGGANAFRQAMNMLREMQVKTWRLLYVLLRESASQYPDRFTDLDDDFLAYIAAAHSAIGLREYCKLGKKSFLKFLKTELLALKPKDLHEWRYQMAQVAYDLYDLRVLADSDDWMMLQEHNCAPDQLDRATAREILPMIMAQIQGLNVRDIIKPDRRDFKQAIDKIQDLIGSPKASAGKQTFNRKQLLTLQKKAIRGTDLMNSLKGIGGFTNMPVKNDFTEIAKTGWYFVVGYLRLAGFRSVKRTGPDSTKELTEAMEFLKFDIDYDCEKWETWYRLAQVYDSMLDEEVTWTADRINNKMDDLVTLQRQAIHCYSTAVALATRLGDTGPVKTKAQSEDMTLTMSELFSDFGKRLYASSRAPFDMHAFSVKDHSRWYFTHSQVKFQNEPFKPMTEAAVWLVAQVLFRHALAFRETEWHNWYMLGKCAWKLLSDDDVGGLSQEQVLHAFGKACEVAPLKDSKHPEKGLILEPHAKLVSVVHKLVFNRDLLTPSEGAEWLKKSSYSEKATLKDPKGKKEWLDYARHVIRNLRTADKANWHHRIMARAARMAFEDPTPTQATPAEAAILQLTPHIFTKTMVVQVWRTVFERAGRHFVYTTRYVKFFIELLKMAGDRSGLEALGKKVRKKHAEFINHLDIWTQICKEHVVLLRLQQDVPAMHEETVLFVLPYETFTPNAALLQAWAQPANAYPPVHPLLLVLREAIDLKKLNLNLIPNQGIDDLIGDAYAKLYEEMVPGLVANATNEKNREAMRVDRILMGDSGVDDKAESGTAVSLTNPSGRAKIVGRMEVRRRAEALVQRLASGQGPVKGKAAALAEAAAAQEQAEDSEANAAPSPDANNDADDESELSELDDEPLEDLHDDVNGQEDNEDGGDQQTEVAEDVGHDEDVGMETSHEDVAEVPDGVDVEQIASGEADEDEGGAALENEAGKEEASSDVEMHSAHG